MRTARGAAAATIVLAGAAAAEAGLLLRAPPAASPSMAPSSPPCSGGEPARGAGGGLAFGDEEAPSPECACTAACARLALRSSASCRRGKEGGEKEKEGYKEG